ncbi:hypothetical protein H4217_005832 [Coemansia sp. RSA 1939]|nr:hypothetical protein H4217_005832 [Coemansia sp. RSA 1939]
MKHSCSATQQRWDFLGPSLSLSLSPASAPAIDSSFFAQIDRTLQWSGVCASEIGTCIRDTHFALELTEDQAEILCAANVRFALVDKETMHAYVPFAHSASDAALSYFVDLVSEGGRWLYFGTLAVSGAIPAGTHCTVDEAYAAFAREAEAEAGEDTNASDDGYWDNFLELDAPEAAAHDEAAPVSAPTQAPAPALTPAPAPAALPYLLASSAQCARDAGVSETEFLALAQAAFRRGKVTIAEAL